MIRAEDVVRTLSAYCRRFPDQLDYLRDLRGLIDEGANCLFRKEFRGHITCGAMVVNAKNEVLLIHHRALNRWLMPGGHVEDTDGSLTEAAMRELSEEVGVARGQISVPADWGDVPVHIDRHMIPANPAKGEPAHEHWDFCYVLECSGTIAPTQNGEVLDMRWWAMEMAPERFRATMRAYRAAENSPCR